MTAMPPCAAGARPAKRSSTSRACRLLLALLAPLCLMGCSQPAFVDLEGRGYGGEHLAGRWLVINYWATWCAPCLVEIPELNALHGRGGGSLSVFGVNFDGPQGEEALRQRDRMGIAFPVLRAAPHARYGAQRPAVLPTTLVISPAGELAATLVGPQTEAGLLAVMSPPDGQPPP